MIESSVSAHSADTHVPKIQRHVEAFVFTLFKFFIEAHFLYSIKLASLSSCALHVPVSIYLHNFGDFWPVYLIGEIVECVVSDIFNIVLCYFLASALLRISKGSRERESHDIVRPWRRSGDVHSIENLDWSSMAVYNLGTKLLVWYDLHESFDCQYLAILGCGPRVKRPAMVILTRSGGLLSGCMTHFCDFRTDNDHLMVSTCFLSLEHHCSRNSPLPFRYSLCRTIRTRVWPLVENGLVHYFFFQFQVFGRRIRWCTVSIKGSIRRNYLQIKMRNELVHRSGGLRVR